LIHLPFSPTGGTIWEYNVEFLSLTPSTVWYFLGGDFFNLFSSYLKDGGGMDKPIG
jgi:hypothetical protein